MVRPATASSAGRRLLAATAGAGTAGLFASGLLMLCSFECRWGARTRAVTRHLRSCAVKALGEAPALHTCRGASLGASALIAAAERARQRDFGAELARLQFGSGAPLGEHVGLGRQHDKEVAEAGAIALQ